MNWHSDFSFLDLARAYLGEWAQSHGLSCEGITEFELALESPEFHLEVVWEPDRCNIGCSFGYAEARSKMLFSLKDLQALDGVDPVRQYWYTVSSVEGMRVALGKIKGMLERAGPGLVGGSADVIAFLEAQSRKRSEDLTAWAVTGAGLARAQAAWEKRDFASVVRELGAIEPYLGGTDRARLLYARNRLGRPGVTGTE